MYPSNVKEIAEKRIEEYYCNEDVFNEKDYVAVSALGVPSILPSISIRPFLSNLAIFAVVYYNGDATAVRI